MNETRRLEDPRSQLHRISFDAGVCGGKPCIKGTRIRVLDVLQLLAANVDREEIFEDYGLEPEDLTAALQYAALQVDHTIIKAD